MNNKLYVGNLAFETTGQDLQDLFAGAGSVRETSIISDKFTGRSRGFGFVVMSSDSEAEAAINQFNGHEFQGRSLTVNIARERDARPSGGDRGGDRSGGDRSGGKRNFQRRY
jgi:RNA recognition motif-containing protein